MGGGITQTQRTVNDEKHNYGKDWLSNEKVKDK